MAKVKLHRRVQGLPLQSVLPPAGPDTGAPLTDLQNQRRMAHTKITKKKKNMRRNISVGMICEPERPPRLAPRFSMADQPAPLPPINHPRQVNHEQYRSVDQAFLRQAPNHAQAPPLPRQKSQSKKLAKRKIIRINDLEKDMFERDDGQDLNGVNRYDHQGRPLLNVRHSFPGNQPKIRLHAIVQKNAMRIMNGHTMA